MGILKSIKNAISGALGGGAAGASAGPWGALAGAALGAGASIYGAKKSAKAAKKNTAAQINWEKKQAENRIQWSVQDAINAGVNPGVAVGQAAGISGISPTMPDTSGYQQAGQSLTNAMQLMMEQKKVDSEAGLNKAQELESGVRAGLMPREVAVKEFQAETERRRQEADTQVAIANAERIYALLPGETEQQKQQIMEKSMQIAVEALKSGNEITEEKANKQILEITHGFASLNDIKKIVTGLAGGAVYSVNKKKDRLSAQKIARDNQKNHRTRTFNSRGKLKEETYYEWAD